MPIILFHAENRVKPICWVLFCNVSGAGFLPKTVIRNIVKLGQWPEQAISHFKSIFFI